MITSDGSIIALGLGPHLRAADGAMLEAGQVIGSLNNPLDLVLTGGNLVVTSLGEINGVSGSFTGSILLGTIVVDDLTPGSIFFNDDQIWPPVQVLSDPAVHQLALPVIHSFGNMYSEFLGNARMSSFDIATPNFYFYHPLIETDFSALDQINLDVGAYEFIDGKLSFKDKEILFFYYQ